MVRRMKPARIFGEISMGELRKLIPRPLQVYWLDSKWRLTSNREIKRFLRHNRVDRAGYVNEYHDCDDFAVRLWGDCKAWTDGLCFGLILTKNPPHAMNIFVNARKRVWVVEPQNDKITPYSSVTPHLVIM